MLLLMRTLYCMAFRINYEDVKWGHRCLKIEKNENYVEQKIVQKIYIQNRNPWSERIWSKMRMLWNLDETHFNITYCEGQINFWSCLFWILIGMLHISRKVICYVSTFSMMAPHQYQNIRSLDTDLSTFCGTLSIWSLSNRCSTFLRFHQYPSIWSHFHRSEVLIQLSASV